MDGNAPDQTPTAWGPLRRWLAAAAGLLLGVAGLLLLFPSCYSTPSTDNRVDLAPATASTQPADTSPFGIAKADHLRGVGGDADAHARADEALEELLSADPDNPLLQAYRGSSKLIAARNATFGPIKGLHARAGGKLLDAAVAAEPDNLEIRFLRGISTVNLPRIAGRYQPALDDLRMVLDGSPDAIPAGTLDPAFAAAAALRLAQAEAEEDRSDAARNLYQQAIDLAPQSGAADQARAALAPH
ncbi:MAG: hypothetical protein AAGI68_02625 [Planctomycetota bacterium]